MGVLGVVCQLPVCRGDERVDFFESRIRPLLLEKCIECHGPAKQENGVRLDRRSDVVSGVAAERPLVSVERPEDSRLLQVLAHSPDDTAMPPSGKLSPDELDAVRTWIVAGAVWPESSDLEGEARRRMEAWREHWAFQPPQMPDLSRIPAGLSPVDGFVREALQEKNLAPSPEAGPEVLVRRMSFALVGLPPEPEELAAARIAVDDGSWAEWKAAYIDRLLQSPHFGERWGRYWLDIARYADTKGYMFQEDREYPDAWRYREWVIQALNRDMPYDEFLKRQLSADRMPGSDDPAQLAAMGFLTLGRRFLNNPHDIIDDRIDVVSRGMLGLTVSCARCHDHKFDPIPTADYYALYGVFASSEEPRNEPSTLRMVDRDQPVEPHIFLRGSPGNRGDRVPRRFLTALSAADAVPFTDGSGRLELAGAIASRANPLTARVAVNRIWLNLFGRGLVDTPSDFGVRTPLPSHPELLDWLAVDFMDHHWSVKHVIRTIVSSQSWQQKSDRRPDAETVDPENRLLSRMNRRRLDLEALRDATLFVAGQLDRTIGGKSTDIAADPNATRRSVYARIDRQNLPGMFRTFDLASPDSHSPRRYETTVPQQALFQLNSPFVMTRAGDAAALTAGTPEMASEDRAARIDRMFTRILQRDPTDVERNEALIFLEEQSRTQSASESRGGWSYGYGSIDESRNVVDRFTEFPQFHDGRWQGGKKLPDGQLGWASLSRKGGHPGGTRELFVIRRWTADADSRLTCAVVLEHPREEGDGVRLRIIAPEGHVLADLTADGFNAVAPAASLDIKAGQTVDFVVDCRENENSDGFRSRIVLTQSVDGRLRRVWNSEDDFRDPTNAGRLDPWAQLAQALLLTNEFAFVD
jgi:hypothetical protein